MTPYEREILIRTIIGEAADQGPEGWAAVAHVIRNRMQDPRWPSDPDEVALQPKQFSAWNDPAQGGNHLVNKYSPNDTLFQRVGQVVDQTMAGELPDPTGGATHYYAPAGMPGGREPTWFDEMTQERGGDPTRIGGHVFTGRVMSTGNQYVPRPRMPGQSPQHPDVLHGLVTPDTAPSQFIPLPGRKPQLPQDQQPSMMAGIGGLLQSLGGDMEPVEEVADAVALENDLADAIRRRRQYHQNFTWL